MQVKSGHGMRKAKHHHSYPKSSAARKRLHPSEFVFGEGPPSSRHMPLTDAEHAGRAIQSLTRIAGRHGVTQKYREEALAVLKEVKRKFPGVYEGEHELVREVMQIFGIVDR